MRFKEMRRLIERQASSPIGRYRCFNRLCVRFNQIALAEAGKEYVCRRCFHEVENVLTREQGPVE